MEVGFVGLGNMGGALAARLVGEGLAVYDLNHDAMQRLVEQGAVAADSLPSLAATSDVVLLCLPTSAHVRAAIFGADGLLAGLHPGSLVIDQTSSDPRETRLIATQLAEQGIDFIDAPVSGGPLRAAEGTIAIMVGASEELYQRALPVLGRISDTVIRAGAVGDGHVMKLVNNMMSGIIRWATLEGVALAAKQGISPETAVRILAAGGASNSWMNAVMAPQVIHGDLSNGFSVGLAHKDLKLACELGEDVSVPLLIGNLTREIYRMCANEFGYDTKVDSTALMMDRLAGTHVVPADYRFA